MNKVYLRKLIRDQKYVLISLILFSICFEYLYAWVFFESAASNVVEGFLKILPPAISNMLDVQAGTQYFAIKMLAFGYAHPIILITLSFLPLSIPARYISGEIESKTFDVLLSRPVTRLEILTSQILFLFFAEGLIVLSMFLGTVLGNAHFELRIIITDYFRITVAGYFFYLSMGSIAFAVAAFQDERGKALAKTVGIVIFLYFLDTILKLNKSLSYLLTYSYFQLYRPGELVTGESNLYLSIMISLILIISFLSIAHIKFLKRDL